LQLFECLVIAEAKSPKGWDIRPKQMHEAISGCFLMKSFKDNDLAPWFHCTGYRSSRQNRNKSRNVMSAVHQKQTPNRDLTKE